MTSREKDFYETIIVGAGVYGLAYAKTLQSVQPGAEFLILDAKESIGGNWAKENLYPGLRTNNIVDTFQYVDFPISKANINEELQPGVEDHVSGEAVHAYLKAYANQKNLLDKIHLRSEVTSAEEIDIDGSNGWKIRVLQESFAELTLSCRFLIIASGTCTVPGRFELSGATEFGKPCLDFVRFRHDSHLLDDKRVQHVTVVGESKSAMDVIYALATANKRVTWIIRKSSNGLRYMSKPHLYLGPFRKWLEGLVLTRPIIWFSPAVIGLDDGSGFIRGLLHKTALGRKLVNAFWAKLSSDVNVQGGLYDSAEKLKPLVPRDSLVWHGTQSSILNFPIDFYDLIRNGTVDLLEQDVKTLRPHGQIVFDDDTAITTDALITIKGWQFTPSLTIEPASKHAQYGISSRDYTLEQKQAWQDVDTKAQADILEKLPILASSPYLRGPAVIKRVEAKRVAYEPWRLYHGMVPPSQAASGHRNIAFLGQIQIFQTFLDADVSSMWVYSYLDHKLARDPRDKECGLLLPGKDIADVEERIRYRTSVLGRWGLLRHPFGCAKSGIPDLMMDGLPYVDLLLADIGLNPWRKGWGWLGEVFGGHYTWDNYKSLMEEWKQHIGPKKKAE